MSERKVGGRVTIENAQVGDVFTYDFQNVHLEITTKTESYIMAQGDPEPWTDEDLHKNGCYFVSLGDMVTQDDYDRLKIIVMRLAQSNPIRVVRLYSLREFICTSPGKCSKSDMFFDHVDATGQVAIEHDCLWADAYEANGGTWPVVIDGIEHRRKTIG